MRQVRDSVERTLENSKVEKYANLKINMSEDFS